MISTFYKALAAALAAACMTCAAAPLSQAGGLDDDLDEIWTTRDIPAHTGTQLFTTARRFELALNIGFIPNDDYYNYFPVIFDAHYRFTEMWGLMLRGSILMAHTNTTLGEFIDAHQSTMKVEYLGDEQRGDISVMASFHPVYGKSVVDTTVLGRFDWGIFAGIGAVISNSTNEARTKRGIKAHAEGILGTDFHVFFLDWLALRLEASMRFYHAPAQWVVPCTISVGVSFFTPEI